MRISSFLLLLTPCPAGMNAGCAWIISILPGRSNGAGSGSPAGADGRWRGTNPPGPPGAMNQSRRIAASRCDHLVLEAATNQDHRLRTDIIVLPSMSA